MNRQVQWWWHTLLKTFLTKEEGSWHVNQSRLILSFGQISLMQLSSIRATWKREACIHLRNPQECSSALAASSQGTDLLLNICNYKLLEHEVLYVVVDRTYSGLSIHDWYRPHCICWALQCLIHILKHHRCNRKLLFTLPYRCWTTIA